MRQRKLFAGRKLKELRSAQALTQAAMAEQLGISTSYLNQLENNQRHLSAAVLMALAETFGLDIRSLSDSDDDRMLADLAEVFADPLVGDERPSTDDMRLVAQNAPALGRAVLALHQSLRRVTEVLADETPTSGDVRHESAPWEEVRDYFHYMNNYIHELDQAAERLAGELPVGVSRQNALAGRLEERHRVRVVTDRSSPTTRLWAFDAGDGLLRLNGSAPGPTRAFHIARHIALAEHGDLLDDLVAAAAFRTEDAARVCRIGLANYFAGATLLPYGAFAERASAIRHDVNLLSAEFNASLEQVMHRLSTLQRPARSGVPFFFARVDQAGNITKRHSASKLQFARFGAACPLWNVHRAFDTPGRMIRQLAETPDGERYLCLAIAIDKPTGGYLSPVQRFSYVLGCEIKYADRLVYSDGLDLRGGTFEPIGVSCRICPRRDCHQRAVPPFDRQLVMSAEQRDVLPYSFR